MLWSFFISGIWTALGWVFRQVAVKFVVGFAMFWVVKLMAEAVIAFLPAVADMAGLMSGVPPGVWWVADMFQLHYGFPLVMSAFCSRFIIRRIPFLG